MQIILEDISQGYQEKYTLIYSEFEVNIISQGDSHHRYIIDLSLTF